MSDNFAAGPIAFSVVTYADRYLDGVKAVWAESFSETQTTPAELVIAAKLAVQPDLLVIATAGDSVIGSVMGGYDGHRGWLYAVAVLKSRRRNGVGTALIREVETRLACLGCTKINLQVRPGNPASISFYAFLGYLVEDRISMGKRVTGLGA